MRLIYLISLFLFFYGCSSKEVYEPENITGSWEKTKSLKYEVVSKTDNIALLENGYVYLNKNIIKPQLKKGFELLSYSKDYIISSTIDGNLSLYNVDNNSTIDFYLKKTIATASTDGDVLAVLFADDEIGLYSLKNKEAIFKLQGNEALANDSRIVKPYFMKDLVLFFTLDGKAVIVNKNLRKKLRTIIVSSADFFNNIIYFDLFNQKLIIATSYRVLLFGEKEKKIDIEARDITHDDKNIFIATKQGDILFLDEDLKVLKKHHFPFAHFKAIKKYNNHLYALEKEGYLIKLSNDFLVYDVYEIDIDDDAQVLKYTDRFVAGDKEIVFE